MLGTAPMYARAVALPLPPAAGVEHRDVQLPGVRLHVAEAGAGDPVLLLHGWPQHWWEWRRVIPLLAGDHRLIAPDNRGFGWSEAPGSGYDPPTFAADAVALLDALGIERAFVIGHDWGGFSSLLLALDHPERIRAVLAVSTPQPWIPRTARSLLEFWRAWYVLLMASGAGERGLRSTRFARNMDIGAKGAFTEEEKETYAAVLRDPARARATRELYRAYLRTARASLRESPYAGRRLTVPTRLLLGTRDTAIPVAWATGIEQHGDDAAAELVPDGTHWLPETHPELVAQRARELFARAA
jgi:pimeloyl-ACP methyl ester carboxylesterase